MSEKTSMGIPARKTSSEYSELLGKLTELPTLPFVATRVNELINDPRSSSADIAEVLKKDQVLTAKVLRLVNSSYYAIPGGVTDVQRALAFLGFNTLAQLILSLSVFTLFKTFEGEEVEFSMLDFWKHALGTAVCGEALAKRMQLPKPEEAFTCGLLHDIGKLALHEIDPTLFQAIVREASKSKRSFLEVEREWEVPNHAFLGEQLATRWGLPQVIRLAIRYHHQDTSTMGSILASAKPLIQIVRLSNVICNKNGIGKSGDCSKAEITPDMLEALKLTPADVLVIEKELHKNMEKAGAFLNAYR